MGNIVRSDDFCEKDVINVCDGRLLGNVSDIEFDICEGKIIAVVVPERCGLFSHGEDIVIPWCKIQKIGEDVILVNAEECCKPRPGGDKKKRGFW